jgi:hypothetical protein
MTRRIRQARLLDVALIALSATTTTSAAPTLDQVFQSLNESIQTPADPTPLLAALATIAGVILLVVVWNNRQPRTSRRQVGLNSQSRVTREVARALRLKRSELRQLRAAAEGMQLKSPLTLLLCPSLLASAMKNPKVRADRSVLASVARRLLNDVASRSSSPS